MEAQTRTRNTDPTKNLDGGMVNVTVRPVYTRETDPVPIAHKAGWALGPVWTGPDNFALTGIRFSAHPVRHPHKFNRYTVKKGKAVPLQAWGGPEGSRKLRFPDFITTAEDGGKVVGPTHRPPLPPVNIPGTHFC